MKSLMLAAVVAMTAASAFAQTRQCVERETATTYLAEKYGESVQGIGMMPGGLVMEIWANVETGTWTVVSTQADGMTCLIASGDAFERMDKEASPTGLRL